MYSKRVWYSDKVDPNSPDVVHQTLMFGTLKEIASIKKRLGEAVVKKLFLKYPKKVYTNSTLNFIKNIVLRIKEPVDEQKYLKSTPRHIG